MHLLALQPVMQSGGMPSGRAFLHLRCKKKTPTRTTRPVPERGKCEVPTLNEKWQTGAVKLKNANPQSQATCSARTRIFKALPREGCHPHCTGFRIFWHTMSRYARDWICRSSVVVIFSRSFISCDVLDLLPGLVLLIALIKIFFGV